MSAATLLLLLHMHAVHACCSFDGCGGFVSLQLLHLVLRSVVCSGSAVFLGLSMHVHEPCSTAALWVFRPSQD